MLRGKSTFLLVVLFTISFNPSVFASYEWIDIYDDLEISGEAMYPGLVVYDTPPGQTTVTMSGGEVIDGIEMHDSSILNVTGGITGRIWASDNSTVTIWGGDASSVTAESGTINIIGGEVSGINVFRGVVNISGGTITGDMRITSSGIINITGGQFFRNIFADDVCKVNIFGYNLHKSDVGGENGVGYVSGHWADETQFTIEFKNTWFGDTYSHIQLHEIPEPATLALFALGAVAVCRKRLV